MSEDRFVALCNSDGGGPLQIEGQPIARHRVADRQAERDQALRDLLFCCLDAMANGVPLPIAVDAAMLAAESVCPPFGDAESLEIIERLKLCDQ